MKTPADYNGDLTRFLLSEYLFAEFVINHPADELGTTFSSGFGRKLIKNKYNAAVDDLRGCTSVIVVSQSAIWLSHFWESPSFRDIKNQVAGKPRTNRDRLNFDEQVLNQITNGSPHLPGLLQFTAPGGDFSAAEDPRWIIVTPRHLSGVPGQYQYEPEVAEMKAVLGRLFPNAPPVVADYLRYIAPGANAPLGKVLVQYDPFQTVLQTPNNPCFVYQRAMVRVWVQDGPDPVFERQWNANRAQFIPGVWRDPTCSLPSNFPQAPRARTGPNLAVSQAPGANAVAGLQVLFPNVAQPSGSPVAGTP